MLAKRGHGAVAAAGDEFNVLASGGEREAGAGARLLSEA
jgi:hypothetical protein